MAKRYPCVGCLKSFSIHEIEDHLCPTKRYTSEAGLLFAQCDMCLTWPCTEFQHHCVVRDYKGKAVDLTRRRWEPTIQCWVLDVDITPAKSVQQAKPKEEVKEDKPPEPPLPVFEADKDDDFISRSEEQPPEDWPKKSKGNKYYSSHYVSNWTPCYPWDKIDRKKMPTTWWVLFTLYHLHDWYKGAWIPEDDWKARLKGEYRPVAKYPNYSNYRGHYGPYYEGCD